MNEKLKERERGRERKKENKMGERRYRDIGEELERDWNVKIEGEIEMKIGR